MRRPTSTFFTGVTPAQQRSGIGGVPRKFGSDHAELRAREYAPEHSFASRRIRPSRDAQPWPRSPSSGPGAPPRRPPWRTVAWASPSPRSTTATILLRTDRTDCQASRPYPPVARLIRIRTSCRERLVPNLSAVAFESGWCIGSARLLQRQPGGAGFFGHYEDADSVSLGC
jgi:hypothetical protein